MSDEVPKDDGIKLAETEATPSALKGVQSGGGKPRSIRSKGFWRAFRRGELWVICSYARFWDLKIPLWGNKVIPDRHCPDSEIYIIYPLEESK